MLFTKDVLEAIHMPSKIKAHGLLEITNYWRVRVDNLGIEITAYDGANYVRTLVEIDPSQVVDFVDVVVNGPQFGNLVRKTTKSTIRIIQKEDHLQFKGNGTYKLPIVPESYPKVPDIIVSRHIYYGDYVQDVLKFGEIATSGDTQDGPLQGYLIRGNYLVTADRIKICVADFAEPETGPILLSPEMAKLLRGLKFDTRIEMGVGEDGLVHVESEHMHTKVSIIGPQLSGIDDFPDLSSVIGFDHKKDWQGDTKPVLSAISRINLLAPTFEDNTLQIRFDGDGMSIYSEHGGVEQVHPEGEEVRETGPVDVVVNGYLLEDILSNCGEEVMISYGGANFITIYDFARKIDLLLATVGGE